MWALSWSPSLLWIGEGVSRSRRNGQKAVATVQVSDDSGIGGDGEKQLDPITSCHRSVQGTENTPWILPWPLWRLVFGICNQYLIILGASGIVTLDLWGLLWMELELVFLPCSLRTRPRG